MNDGDGGPDAGGDASWSDAGDASTGEPEPGDGGSSTPDSGRPDAGCTSDGAEECPSDLPAAVRWDVSVATAQDCVRPNSALELTVSVYDEQGDLVPNPQYEVTSDVDGALEEVGSLAWTVRAEGELDLTVTYAGRTSTDSTVEPVHFRLVSDGTPPLIALDQPARGAMVVSATDVALQGHVTDASSAVVSVLIDGEEQLDAAAGQDYAIDASLPGRWGLNVIELEATDACGNHAYLAQSYLRSDQYRPLATAPNTAARVGTGHLLRLSQAAVDDRNRADVDDLATLVERYLRRNLPGILRQATANALIASAGRVCVPPSPGYDVRITAAGVSLAPLVDSITLETGRTRQLLSAFGMTAPLSVHVVGPCGTLDETAPVTLSANVQVDSRTNVTINASGQLQVTLASLDVTLTNINVSLTGIALIDDAISGLANLFAAQIGAMIDAQLESLIPPLLQQVFSSFRPQVTLPGALLNLNLNATTGLEDIEITPAAMLHSAYAQLYPSAVGTPYDELAQGSIARPTTPPALGSSPGPVTYAVDDNLINQGLWALWYGGALEIADVIGFPGAAMRISALLPPVLMPGSTAGTAAIGLGDLHVVLDLDLEPGTIPVVAGHVRVEAYVSIVLEGSILYDGIARQLRLNHEPGAGQVYLQITSVGDGTDPITDPEMLAPIEEYARGLIAGFATEILDGTLVSAPLPPLRFSLTEPSGGAVDTMIVNIGAVTRTGDHVVVDMSLRAELPSGQDGYLALAGYWDESDLADQGILPGFYPSLVHWAGEHPAAWNTITVSEYENTTLPSCRAAGLNPMGEAICLSTFDGVLNYGIYCGAGRPVGDYDGNDNTTYFDDRPLDAVDACCRLHDLNHFDTSGLAALSPINACGFVMCLRQATTDRADISELLPEVERARQGMYRRAKLLCGGLPPADLPPPVVVP